jgi:ketosteroid isomerase-like protein
MSDDLRRREALMAANAEPSVEQDNKDLVTEFMEVFGTGNVDDILSFMSDTATWWVGGTMEGVSGTKNRDAFGEMLAGLAALTESGAIGLKPLAWTCQGERIAVETESYSKLNNGRVYNNFYHFVFEVRDGKIQSVREYLDTQHTYSVFLAP